MRPPRWWRFTTWTVVVTAGVVTLLAITLVFAAYRNDATIAENMGTANAEVLSVGWDRTIIRFDGPNGIVHTSQDGVLYPAGLVVGQRLAVEYDVNNPNLVRVAGRTAQLSLLPASTTILFTWLVAGPLLALLWWVRRRASR